MTDPLVLKYRPQTFADIIGQRLSSIVLERMVEEDQVPSGLLFSGPSGVGKTTAARILADALSSDGNLELDAASNGGVAEIRALIDIVRYSTGADHRVLVLDEAQSITKQGYEALLKTLEEPPPGVHFVLVTTEPHKIPDTILSRLIEFQFRSVGAGVILDRLRYINVQEKLDVDVRLLAHLAQQSGGNVRTAIQSLDMVARSGVASLEGYQRLVGEQDPAPALMHALASGDHSSIFALLEDQLTTIASPAQVQSSLVACIRDLFILKAGGELQFTGTPLEERKQLARQIESERLLLAVRMLWDVKTKLRVSDDPRGNLELALILVSEAFTRGKNVAQPVPIQDVRTEAVPSRRLSLAEMRSKGA